MRCFLLVVFLLLTNCFVQAQAGPADSLQNELSLAQEDSSRLRLMVELAEVLYREQADSALALLREALPIAEKIDSKSDLLDLYYRIGTILGHKHLRDSALVVLDTARQLAIELNKEAILSDVLYEMGLAHKILNHKKLALDYLQQSYAAAERVDDLGLQFFPAPRNRLCVQPSGAIRYGGNLFRQGLKPTAAIGR